MSHGGDPEFPPLPAGSDALGGYLALEPAHDGPLPDDGPPGQPWSGATGFQSARAAFLALLTARRPSAVWLPWFVCDSLLEAPRMAGIPVHRYALDEMLRLVDPPAIGDRDWIVGVDHFGLGAPLTEALCRLYPASQLVFDHAQALYAPSPGPPTLYSPRKFVGVADGGLLVGAPDVEPPPEPDTGTASRQVARRLRRSAGAEAGHASFVAAERGLSCHAPRQMSVETRARLAAIDHAAVCRARRERFGLLHAALGPFNRLAPELGEGMVPLCYPFWPRRPVRREALHRARIYVPTYWPELLDPDGPAPETERRRAAEWLALPVDQQADPVRLETHLVAPLLRHLAGT